MTCQNRSCEHEANKKESALNLRTLFFVVAVFAAMLSTFGAILKRIRQITLLSRSSLLCRMVSHFSYEIFIQRRVDLSHIITIPLKNSFFVQILPI